MMSAKHCWLLLQEGVVVIEFLQPRDRSSGAIVAEADINDNNFVIAFSFYQYLYTVVRSAYL